MSETHRVQVKCNLLLLSLHVSDETFRRGGSGSQSEAAEHASFHYNHTCMMEHLAVL